MYHPEVRRDLASLREQSYLVNAQPRLLGRACFEGTISIRRGRIHIRIHVRSWLVLDVDEHQETRTPCFSRTCRQAEEFFGLRRMLLEGGLAERVGFEPTVPCGTPDFESGTFDHSATSPGRKRCGRFQKARIVADSPILPTIPARPLLLMVRV